MKRTNQKGFANIALVLVIVIIAGAVGYFAFVKKSEPVAQQLTPTPTRTTTPTKTPTSPTPTPDKISTWKTYTNTSVGYSMRYPSNLNFVNLCGGEGDYITVPETTCGEAFLDEPNTNNPEKQLYVRVVDNKDGLLMKTFAQSSLRVSEIVESISEQNFSGKAGTTAVFTGALNFSANPKDVSGRFYSGKIRIIFIGIDNKKVLEITYPSANEIYKQAVGTLTIK